MNIYDIKNIVIAEIMITVITIVQMDIIAIAFMLAHAAQIQIRTLMINKKQSLDS
jgi:hypothetical protein